MYVVYKCIYIYIYMKKVIVCVPFFFSRKV